jgi:hypothetical protein
MGNFYYNPGVQDRSGELLARGIEKAGDSLADAITKIGQQHAELKGWKALADARGIDTKKLNLEGIKLKVANQEWEQGQADRARVARGYAAQRNVLGDLLGKTQGTFQPNAVAGAITGAGDNGAGGFDLASRMVGQVRPPQLNLSAGNQTILEALNKNRDLLFTPAGQTLFDKITGGMAAQPKQAPQAVDVGGTKMIWDPTTGRMMQPRAVPAPVPQDWQPVMKDVNGVKMYQDKPNGTWKALPLSEQRAGGGQPELSQDGKFFRTGPMDSWKPMPKNQGTEEFLKMFGGGGQPAGDGEPKPKRVRVTGPNGEKGTVEDGEDLPEGWSLE